MVRPELHRREEVLRRELQSREQVLRRELQWREEVLRRELQWREEVQMGDMPRRRMHAAFTGSARRPSPRRAGLERPGYCRPRP